jgi:hypothetical protein
MIEPVKRIISGNTFIDNVGQRLIECFSGSRFR